MQILTLLGIGKTLTKIVAALYRSIAAIYTDMLNLVDTFTKGPLADTLNSIVGNVYVLVGVFMLFRIGVSLLNYLVDPSKLDDKKVGGGQLVMHILISIVLLLSLNFVFKWTSQLQLILLEKDGVLYKIISTGNAEMSKLNDLQLINTQEVSVVSKKYMDNNTKKVDCYYSYISSVTDGPKNFISSNNFGTIRITFIVSDNETSQGNQKKILNSSFLSKGSPLKTASSTGWKYFYWESNNISGGDLYAKDDVKSIIVSGYSEGKGNCPASISNIECDNSSTPICRFKGKNGNGTLSSAQLGDRENGLIEPGNSPSEAKESVIKRCKEDVFLTCSTDSDDFNEALKTNKSIYDNSKISEDGFEFSTITLSAFVTPSTEFDSTFLKLYSGDYSSDWWAKQIEDEEPASSGVTYAMDWLLAIICGIAIIAILVAIMIEVVIRNLKLVILQAIAPIPVVSYMNPNDKMLGTWVKQYVGVYFSLFLQLLVILLIPNLMMSLLRTITGGFIIKIIIIAGCLLFTKEAPKFIGKLLGLDNMEGSFGDAFKMVKTGLGIGAGAAAGAVMGGITGFGAGGGIGTVLGGMAGGAFRGAKGGASGKIFEGANTQRQRNVQVKAANASGSTAFGRFGSKWNRFWGQKDRFEKAEGIHKGASDSLGLIGNYKEEAEKSIIKHATAGTFGTDNEFTALAAAKNELNKAQITGGDVNAAMEKYKKAQKIAISKYNDLLRGKNVEIGTGTYNFSTLSDDAKSSLRENQERLGAVDASVKNLRVSDANGNTYTEYSADAESAIKLTKETAQKEMEKSRADHMIANSNSK